MADRAPGAVISIRDLVVGFGDQIVLDHLSLDVRRGEVLGVVGASGSGKSVLLRTVIGLLPKRAGAIVFAGLDEAGESHDENAMARRWGVLFQQGALFSSLTVRQNVEFPMRENLDLSELREELASLIRTLQQTLGLTVFMVTHDLDSLNAVCDRIAVLADGKVVVEGQME